MIVVTILFSDDLFVFVAHFFAFCYIIFVSVPT